MLLKKACRDRRSIASGAVHQQRTVCRELSDALDQVIERNAEAAVNVLLGPLAGRADVNREGSAGRQPFCGERRADAFGRSRELGALGEDLKTAFEIPDDVVKADASEPCRRFAFAARVRNDDDRMLVINHGTGPRGVLAAETDVD